MHIQSHIRELEFPESEISPGKTEVKQGKFMEFISPYEEKRVNHKSFYHKT